MSPLKGEFDNAVELPQGKLFWFVKQRRRSLSSAFLFFFSCSLILQWIFKYYCDLFIAAQCSASWSYFQVDIFTGRRVGSHIDLYMGGVALDFVTALDGMPGRASFCCCLKGSVTFSSSSPQGLKESVLAWFHQPPGAIYRGSVWKDEEKRKGHLRHRVSCRWQDDYMLTFLRTVVCYTLMGQTWKPWQPGVTYHLIVHSAIGDPILRIQ